VSVVDRSWDVPVTVIVLGPTTRLRAADGLPLVTVFPFTVTVAFTSVVVGVTVTLVTALATSSV